MGRKGQSPPWESEGKMKSLIQTISRALQIIVLQVKQSCVEVFMAVQLRNRKNIYAFRPELGSEESSVRMWTGHRIEAGTFRETSAQGINGVPVSKAL